MTPSSVVCFSHMPRCSGLSKGTAYGVCNTLRIDVWRDLTTEAHLRVALFQRPVMADFIIFVATY